MHLRQLGNSDLKVPLLCLGAGAFDGGTGILSSLLDGGLQGARRMVDYCLDAGVSFFDASDPYARNQSDRILGKALRGKRGRAILSAAGTPGQSIAHDCEATLRRLGTDYLDIYKFQGAEESLRLDEVLSALDHLVRSGKVRYLACSSLTAGQLANALAASERRGWARYAAHEVYYSLIGRNYENELMQLGLERGVGAIVSNPPGGSRGHSVASDQSPLPHVVEVAGAIAKETGKTIPQIALSWLLAKPTVCSVIVGARNVQQLKLSVDTANWSLTAEQIALLDRSSERTQTASCAG